MKGHHTQRCLELRDEHTSPELFFGKAFEKGGVRGERDVMFALAGK